MPMKRDTGVEGREVKGRKARRGLNLREVRWEVLWVIVAIILGMMLCWKTLLDED